MSENKKASVSYQIAIIGVLFFIFGFITWANGSLIPYLKIACELSSTQSYYVASAFFAAYFIMAIPSSLILKKTGFKNGMSLGLFVMALGALLFIPAAQTRTYNLFLLGLFIIGTGLALLQTAANPFVTVLGPIESAAQRISIMGICNKIAGICAIYVLGSITLKDADGIQAKLLTLTGAAKATELDALAARVIQPYMILASILAVLAVIIYFIKMPEVHEEETNVDSELSKSKSSIFQFPHLLLGALAIFFYVGVEVISYDTFAGFGEHLGYKLDVARNFATYTGYALLAGYIFNIVAIPSFISQQKAMFWLTILSMVLVILSVFTTGKTAVVCFMLLGFSNAIMWPAIWPLAIDGLGKFTKLGSALLIMGIVGGAILPPLYGKISELINNKQMAYLIMIPAYLFILYYAMVGHKVGREKV
ncbi:MAG TPA: sugar MFS transporter [Chitinophagales bacterium]|jgi:FHS family L-fucose permease-like MFS transporter|nr:sugar MFS transporter [Chitinophagales bacterium]